jgi:hypothetical protein
MAIMNFTLANLTSQESDLDQKLEQLIEKMVSNTATPKERAEYQELAAQRARLLRPVLPEKFEKIRVERSGPRKTAM